MLRYLAGGRYELGETLPLDAGKILGAGLALSAGTAVASLLARRAGAVVGGDRVRRARARHVKFVTALFFDLGVYLIVVGLVLDVLRSLGARVDEEMIEQDRSRAGGGEAMTTYLVPLILIGGLTSAGVYLLLERNLTRMLLGLLLIGNAINLLILTVGGPSGNPPVRGRTSAGETTTADPLAQAHDPDRDRHHDGRGRLRAGADVPVLPADHRSRKSATTPRTPGSSQLSGTEHRRDRGRPEPDTHRDTDAPDELDALPGLEGSR